MPVNYGGKPFSEAINFLKNKLNIPTEHWDDMMGEIHAKGFTVAGATKIAMVEDFHQSLNDMLANGKTIADFRKDFDSIVEKYGWSYIGKRGWRTSTIYDNNMRNARMAGKWAQYQRVKKLRPYLQYKTAGDSRVRPKHEKWHNWVIHIDDIWWDTHYPPNDFGCRCGARSLSERQVKKMGLKVIKSPPIKWQERYNIKTGEIYQKTPEGIGTGWDYNVGKAWLAPDTHFGEQILIIKTPGIRTDALNRAAKEFTVHSDGAFKTFMQTQIDQRNNKEIRPTNIIKTAGFISGDVINKLASKDILPLSATITISDAERKIIRDSSTTKNRIRNTTGMSQVIPDEYALIIPEIIRSPNAVLWDTEKPGLIYAYKIKDNTYLKLVVDISKYRKINHNKVREKLTSNYLHSAEVLERSDLKVGRYEIVEGKL
jgi:SPP1 gp7 family putative phage head morphogenesis protein